MVIRINTSRSTTKQGKGIKKNGSSREEAANKPVAKGKDLSKQKNDHKK